MRGLRLLFLSALVAQSCASLDVKGRYVAEIKNNVYEVTVPSKYSGTAFVIRSDSTGSYLITNHHVCVHAEVKTGMFSSVKVQRVIDRKLSKSEDGEIISVSSNADLCLIYMPVAGLPSAELAKNMIKPGEFAATCGNPQSNFGVYLEGHFIKPFMDVDHFLLDEYSMKITYGASGSAVYDSDGKVIGVIARKADNSGYAIPLKVLREFLRSNKI